MRLSDEELTELERWGSAEAKERPVEDGFQELGSQIVRLVEEVRELRKAMRGALRIINMGTALSGETKEEG